MAAVIRNIIGAALIGPLLLWVMTSTGLGQEQEIIDGGAIEFRRHCAACHGVEGKGDGEMAEQLRTRPADLTQLSKKNGGPFPFWRVYRTIDGRDDIRGHGSREMPIWGARFHVEAEGDTPSTRALVAGRILGLVFYLRHIQQK